MLFLKINWTNWETLTTFISKMLFLKPVIGMNHPLSTLNRRILIDIYFRIHSQLKEQLQHEEATNQVTFSIINRKFSQEIASGPMSKYGNYICIYHLNC